MKPLFVFSLFFVSIQSFLMAQPIIINGEVTSSEDRLPLAGVNVIIKGTTQGTITDSEGRYSIEVNPMSDTLIYTFIGYERRELSISSGRTTYDISLAPNSLTLDQVVVSGVAGKTDVKKLSFSVGQVDEEIIKQAPGLNLANAINGKVAGVRVVQGPGIPGRAASIQIRGASSMLGEQSPLILIDGVILEGTLADINSEDVAKVEVLKGAAASSLYGSRAANGVIQIFTKRGAGKKGVSVNIRTEVGVNYLPKARWPKVARHHPYQMDGNDFARNDVGGFILEADGMADNPFPNYVDNVALLFDENPFHSQHISLTNASENSNTYLSFQNLTQDGVLSFDDFGYNRKNVRLNHDFDVSDKIRISTSNLFAKSKSTAPPASGVSLRTMLTAPHHVDLSAPNEEDGSPYNWNAIPESGWPSENENGLYQFANENWKEVRNRFLTNIKLEYDITSFLTFENYYSIDYEVSDFSIFTDKDWLDRNISTRINGFLFRENINSFADNFSSTLRFDKDFGELNVKAKLNYFLENRTFELEQISGTELGVSGFDDLDNIIEGNENVTSNKTELVANSYSLITALDYKDRYLMDFLIRNDDVSVFGPNVRQQVFYRISAAYRITEDFKIPGIQEWKIRASQGTSGLRPPYQAQYESFNVVKGVPTKATLGNENLGPFTAEEFEVGTNISFLNRFDLELNYARKSVKGQVLQVPLPIALGGWPNQWQNIGTLESRAHEANLSMALLDKKHTSWDFNILFTRVEQFVKKLDRPTFFRGPLIIEEGSNWGTFYGNKLLTDLNQLPSEVDAEDYRINSDGYVVDANGNPQFLTEENGNLKSTKIGDTNPDFNMAFNTTFRWKGLSIYALVDWKKGGDIFNALKRIRYFWSVHPDVDQTGIPEADRNPINYYSNLFGLGINDHFIENTTFVKLRELSIQYQFPEKLLDNTFVEKASVGIVGRNLLTFTNYSGIDPETNIPNTYDATNFLTDDGFLPNFTTLSMSLQVTF